MKVKIEIDEENNISLINVRTGNKLKNIEVVDIEKTFELRKEFTDEFYPRSKCDDLSNVMHSTQPCDHNKQFHGTDSTSGYIYWVCTKCGLYGGE